MTIGILAFHRLSIACLNVPILTQSFGGVVRERILGAMTRLWHKLMAGSNRAERILPHAMTLSVAKPCYLPVSTQVCGCACVRKESSTYSCTHIYDRPITTAMFYSHSDQPNSSHLIPPILLPLYIPLEQERGYD